MKIKYILITILISLILPFYASAQSSVTTTSTDILTSIEEQRTKELELSLGINMPLETDNPNHVISFKDPSSKGVKIEIDGQGYKTVTSPYTLPALGIGNHVISFKFYDKEQSPQTLDKNLVVIPRVPVLNAPQTLSKTEITLTGTSLAGSTVEIFLSGDTINERGVTTTQADGTWKYTFTGEYKYAIYSVLARAKKNGFSSSLTDALVFELDQSNKPSGSTVSTSDIYFDLRAISLNNILTIFKNNPHLIILIAFSLLIGSGVTTLIFSLASRKRNTVKNGKFLKKLNKKDKKEKEGKKIEGEKTMTLRERFEKAGYLPASNEEKKEVSEVSKEEFMKEYKNEDPDDHKGKEKKKNIDEETIKEQKRKSVITTLIGKIK